MGKLIKALFSRAFITILLILLQIILMVDVLFLLSRVSVYIYLLFFLISICFVIYLFSYEQAIEYKLIWSVVIMIFPMLGGLFYLLWGKRSTDWRALKDLHTIYQRTAYLLDKNDDDCELLAKEDSSLKRVPKYLKKTAGAGLYKNCCAKYYPCGEELLPDFLDALKSAKHFICMEYFIIEPGKMLNSILEVLKQKAKEGVEIYFMYDDAGSVVKVPSNFHIKLQNFGIKAVKFNKLRPRMYTLMNYRDHRKITVIDGTTAFTGGINLADEYINETHPFGYWKDNAVKVEGDAVWEFTLMFFQLWCFTAKQHVDIKKYRVHNEKQENGYLQFFGDDPLDELNVSEDTYINLISRAKKYIYISTPYLIIDSRILGALQTAARSGIDVRIITPGIPDKKIIFWVTQSYYRSLIESGVKIYEYTPGFLHAKTMVSDDDVAIVGTVNMDYRSLYLHFECATVFYRHSIIPPIKQDMTQIIADSKQIMMNDVNKTWVVKRLLQAIFRVFAPLM